VAMSESSVQKSAQVGFGSATLSRFFALHALLELVLAASVLAFPRQIGPLLWSDPDLNALTLHLARGWGACLLSFSVVAGAASRSRDALLRKRVAIAFILYYAIILFTPFVDQSFRRWTTFGLVEYGARFPLLFGYLAAALFVREES
jgi:hypothetical protein